MRRYRALEMKIAALTIFVWLALFSAVPPADGQFGVGFGVGRRNPRSDSSGKYYQTDLFMGLAIPGGGAVSEEDWEKFLSEVVTPMFPAGFTVMASRGQYRESSGVITKEPSHVIVFLYRKSNRKKAGSNIEKIRSEYKKRFQQESVLRVDMRSVDVTF
jgi:hypothetical protein